MGWPIGCALGFGLTLFALLTGKAYLSRPLAWAPLRWAGLLSYNMYLWHYLFIQIFFALVLPNFKGLAWNQVALYSVFYVWTLLSTISLAVVLYRTLEIPGIRVGEKICRRLMVSTRSIDGSSKRLPEPVAVIPAIPVTAGRHINM